MNFSDYVENKKREEYKNNIQEVRSNIKANWVQKKINNYLQRFPNLFTKEEVENNILNNDIVASFFCKDPTKQNLSEKLCVEVLNLTKLPGNGKNCIRFDNNSNITSSATGNTKSVDFIFNGYYTTQKYTTSEGGAQDNQKNDVIDFLRRGSIKNKVAAILDGEYWDKNRQTLIELFKNNPNVYITSVSELTGD